MLTRQDIQDIQALTFSDYKIHRCRERDFLKKVHESMDKGGKVINSGGLLTQKTITLFCHNFRY